MRYLLSGFLLVTTLLIFLNRVDAQINIININRYPANQKAAYIIAKSQCYPNIKGTLKGKSVSTRGDVIYYLSDGAAWRAYSTQEFSLSNHYYAGNANTFYYKEIPFKERPKVNVYKTSDFLCKIKIEGEDENFYVYKEN